MYLMSNGQLMKKLQFLFSLHNPVSSFCCISAAFAKLAEIPEFSVKHQAGISIEGFQKFQYLLLSCHFRASCGWGPL